MLLDNTYSALIVFFLGFGFLVFVHELGHFLVAKWVGIKCTQFAIGFGPSLLTWRKGLGFRTGSTETEYQKRLDAGADEASMGETEYRLNALPLGGYVKMLGQEDIDPAARSDDPRSFNKKPIWARLCVISAGVVMNIIFGMLFFIIAFMVGVKFPDHVVGGVAPGSPAAVTYAQGHDGDPGYRGLQVGDRITTVNDKPARDMSDVQIASALGNPDQPVHFQVQRSGQNQPLRYAMTPKRIGQEGLYAVGIEMPQTLTATEDFTLDGEPAPPVRPGSPQEGQGIEGGMTLTTAGGKPVADQGELYRIVTGAAGEPVPVVFQAKDGGKTVKTQFTAIPTLTPSDDPDAPINLLGLVPATALTPQDDTPAAKAGVQDGDVVASVGVADSSQDTDWPTAAQFLKTVHDADDGPIRLTVLRDGEEVDLGEITPNAQGLIGVMMRQAESPLSISAVAEGSPFASLNLPGGTVVQQLNGQPVATWADLQRAMLKLDRTKPAEVTMTVLTPIGEGVTETRSLTLSPQQMQPLADAGWEMPQGVVFDLMLVNLRAANPIDAAVIGFNKTVQFIQQTYLTLLRLFQGSVQVKNLRGPVGIVQAGATMTQRGWSYLLFFLGLISVNLAVINFLPIPIVDGGHVVFLLIEKIKGSPISVKAQTAATLAGLALIGLVFVVVTYHDIYRLVAG